MEARVQQMQLRAATVKTGCTTMGWAKFGLLSSTRCTTTSSGNEFRVCSSSWSVVVLGISRPFLLPASRSPRLSEQGPRCGKQRAYAPTHIRPMIRVPATDVRTIGMVSASSDSNTE